MDDKYCIMKIIEKNGKIKLSYLYKITKKTVNRKNKKTGKTTPNKFYQGVFPQEILDYWKIKDNTLYFYEGGDGRVHVIAIAPPEELHQQKIKVQKNNQFSIPKQLLSPEEFDSIRIVFDLSCVDDFQHGLGVCTVELC